jgi:hypothetical protein
MADQTRGDRPGPDRYEGLSEEDRADKVDEWTASLHKKIDAINTTLIRVYNRGSYNSLTQQDLTHAMNDLAALRKMFS